MTTEISHCFCSVFYVSVVFFYGIIVVFKPVFLACYRHAKSQFAHTIEQLVERVAIVLESVSHESDQPAQMRRLVSFFKVYKKWYSSP